MPSITSPPTLAGFIVWIRAVMEISTAVLPDNAPVIAIAYQVAKAIVNQQLIVAPPIYTLAVYNLGGDNLVNYAVDNPALTPPLNTYFNDLREGFTSLKFVPGVVTSSSNVSTSVGLLNIEAMKEFTMANLQNLKTPWGRQYLAFAQDVGTPWGLS